VETRCAGHALPLEKAMTSAEKAKDKRLQEIYKITLEVQNSQRELQGNACACCGRSFSKFTAFQDHWHACCPRRLKKFCGKCNRGLLCYPCNKFVVGILERQSVDGKIIPVRELLKRMVEYFEYWEPILKKRGACAKEKSKKLRGK
jgi:hypothetical protein